MYLLGRLLRQKNITKILVLFRQEIWLAVGVTAVVNILMLSPTIYMLQIFDRVMISQSVYTLAAISAVGAFFYLMQGISEWLRSKLIIATGIKLDYAFNEPIFRATFFEQLNSSINSPTQAFSDLNVIRQWLTGGGLFAFLDLPWTPVYIAVMFLLHPWLGWLTIVFMLFLASFMWLSTRVIGDSADESEEEERELNQFLYNKLRNAEVIEAHGMVPNFRTIWWTRQIQTIKLNARSTDLHERMSASSKQLRFLMNSLALAAGAFFVLRGELTLGAMIAASLLMGRALSPVDTIVAGLRGFSAAKHSFSRIEKLLEKTPEQPIYLLPSEPGGKIELKNLVAYSHDEKTAIIKNISAVFEPGKINLILGRSGAGKSTLIKSLLGIWPKTQGYSLIDGTDIRSIDRNSIGPYLGYLPQDVELFRDTVAANIARLHDIDPSKVIEAAKRANIHEFILGLPKGYDSVIEDGGFNLSGGQRQRLALARAIYGPPKILVLDEPDANLDQSGEQALRQVISSLREIGTSIFIITHHSELLNLADNITVLEDGEVLFSGTQSSFLLQREALYGTKKSSAEVTDPAHVVPNSK